MVIAVTSLCLLAGQAGAVLQMPRTAARTAQVEAQVLSWVQANLHPGYPATWTESVKCSLPPSVKKGTVFHCRVLIAEPGHQAPLSEGAVTVRVTKVQRVHPGYSLSDKVTGTMTSYSQWLAQSAPRTTTTTAAPKPPPTTAAPTTRPPPPPTTTTTSPPATTAPGCYIDPEGNCYRAGEYCPDAMHGQTIQGESGPLVCTDNDGWRWEPA